LSGERPGLLRRVADWFFIEEPVEQEPAPPLDAAPPVSGPQAGTREGEPLPPPTRRGAVRAGRAGRGHPAAWLVAGLALAVAVVAVARGIPRGGGRAAGSAPAASATATLTAAQRATAVAQAKTAADNAARAAEDAQAAAQHVADLLASARADADRVQALAAPSLARRPDATDPSGALAPLRQLSSEAGRTVAAVEADVTAADGSANAAASIAQTVPEAAASADAAASAASQADQALAAAQRAVAGIGDLLAGAQAAVAAWQAVHAAPHGVLGVTVRDPAPPLGVQGCEVVAVEAGGAAARAGLVGAVQRPDGVGDVITAISDAAAAAQPWTTADCAALQAVMGLTRAGDRIEITYLRRQGFAFAAQWVRATADTVLGAPATASATAGATAGAATGTGQGSATGTATAGCPAPITGTITPASAGSRIVIAITLHGPAGDATDLRAILDTGGVATSFPDGLLRQLGYAPYATTQNSGVVPGATATAYLYHVPGSAITVLDGGRAVPLATGELSVIGIPGGSNYTLGPDILEGGSRLSTSGSQWTLTPPC
jgi:hypothetical protein